jgi:hypothetical protein
VFTTVFIAFTMVFNSSTAVFVPITLVFIVSTTAFAGFTVVFDIEKMLSSLDYLFSQVKQ